MSIHPTRRSRAALVPALIARGPGLGSMLFALGLSALGCASGDMATNLFENDPAVVAARGQMIVFVGTDPTTLQTDIYLLQAVSTDPVGAVDPNNPTGPDISEAEGFETSNLTNLLPPGQDPLLPSVDDQLFTSSRPFAIPNRNGSLIAVASTGPGSDEAITEGRIALLGTDSRTTEKTIEVEGLVDVHFTWDGNYLVTQHTDSTSALGHRLEIHDLNPVAFPADEFEFSPDRAVSFLGSIRDSDDILVLATDPTEALPAELWRVVPQGPDSLLVSALPGVADDIVVSPDAQQVAISWAAEDTLNRQVTVFEDGQATDLSDPGTRDCFWPTWSPPGLKDSQTKLAFVCQDSLRSDLLLWNPDDMVSSTLTTSPGADVFDGTMEGVVIRSRPHWDPRAEFLVFGASTQEQAMDAESMTLLALHVDTAMYPIYSGTEGSAGWAHFSAATENRNLLVWDREESGLADSSGQTPLQIVFTDGADLSPQAIPLGQDLMLSYPLFLGANSMLYP